MALVLNSLYMYISIAISIYIFVSIFIIIISISISISRAFYLCAIIKDRNDLRTTETLKSR